MPRTTLNLDASVLMELKRRAKKQRKPLGDVASEELGRLFAEDRAGTTWPPPGWIVKSMGPPVVAIDVGDALWEFLDREMLGALD